VTLLSRHETRGEEEALIKEARRLRRRRWLIGSTLAALAAGAGVAGFIVASPPPARPDHQPPGGGLPTPGYSVPSRDPFIPTHALDLIQPTTLAALPDGELLILDSSRDQILRLTAKGVLSVFAGNGRIGVSGDGGPARDAELDLTYFSSAPMAVTPGGEVYFLDDGSCRVREVSPAGTIHTVLRLALARVNPSGAACPIAALAVSPAGSLYLAVNSTILRVAASGHLIRVAGARRLDTRAVTTVTAPHYSFFPDVLAFDAAGDLFIQNQSPKLVFELTPQGKLTALAGASYAHQLAAAPDGAVLAGTQGGEVQMVTARGVHALYNVVPSRVSGLHWGRYNGFQEDGIAVGANGTIYVDNAQGNGYGLGSVVVRIGPDKQAALMAIRTPLAATLPALGASGFPVSVYPASRRSHGRALAICPSESGLKPFSAAAISAAERIARSYLSGQFASDIAVTDRSWWSNDFNAFADGTAGGTHSVAGERAAAQTPAAAGIERACGARLVSDSVAVAVRPSAYSDFSGTLYLLDRRDHPLVYDVR
jgi:sugar lactone lactonase YvrE